MAGKDVAKAEKSTVPAFLQKADDLSKYQEHMTQDDVSIPFIQILQSLSPQCVEGDPEYMEGARPGMFLNTVTKELTPKDGFEFIPIAYKDSFVEWVPRNQGGGFVREYSVPDGMTIPTARNENGHDIIQDGSPLGKPGNQLNRTHTHFVFKLKKGGGFEPAVLSMAMTQLKPSKNLNSLVQNNPLPGIGVLRFAHVIKAGVELRKNDQGSWYVWSWNRVGFVEDQEIFDAAKTFADGVREGEHKADFAKTEAEGATSSAASGPSTASDEEVPF